MICRAFCWIVVLGVFAGLLWVWASIPFVSISLCLFLAAVGTLPVPILVVLRWNLRGVLIGSLFVLCSGLVVRRVGACLDPYFRGEDIVPYAVAILFFWIVGIGFCFLIYGIKRLTLRLFSGRKPPTT